MDIEELVKELKAVANPDDVVAMKAYMKNKFEFLGVKTPARRKLTKAFFKQHTDSVIDWNFINEAWKNPYRELQYTALDYLEIRKKLLTPSDLPDLKILAQTKSWWDTIDFLDRLVGSIIAQFPETKATILSWSCDEKILVNNLGRTEFFINKAIGWALRDYSKTNPDWVRDSIERHQTEMAALSIREGSKYL